MLIHYIDMTNSKILKILKVLSNDRRLQIIEWLKDPLQHFSAQRVGDLVKDGVCVSFLTKKLRISQPSVTAHMLSLEDAGLVTSKQIKNWVFYKLNGKLVSEFVLALGARLGD